MKDIEFPAVTLCPDFPPDHAALAEQVFNLFKTDCNINDSDCDLMRHDIEKEYWYIYENILKGIDDVQFESKYFGIDYSNCTTVEGPTPDLPCIFPFEFEGLEHHSCIWNPWKNGKHICSFIVPW